jgi:hypothetical protein
VERSSRYVVLLHLPHGRTAEDVRAALTRQVSKLPAELRRTLTWDQGKERTDHGSLNAVAREPNNRPRQTLGWMNHPKCLAGLLRRSVEGKRRYAGPEPSAVDHPIRPADPSKGPTRAAPIDRRRRRLVLAGLPGVRLMSKQDDTIDWDRVAEMTLALMHLTSFKEQGVVRSWKGHDWDALSLLHQKASAIRCRRPSQSCSATRENGGPASSSKSISERPCNNEMKLTRPATARQSRPLQLISVSGGPASSDRRCTRTSKGTPNETNLSDVMETRATYGSPAGGSPWSPNKGILRAENHP